MNKEEQIQELLRSNEQLQLKIKNNNELIKTLESMEEKSLSYMIQEYENDDSEVVVKVKVKGKYTVILGGDGRSSPWDKEVEGKVLKVAFKNIYLSNEDEYKFKQYIIATKPKDIDCIKINGLQIIE